MVGSRLWVFVVFATAFVHVEGYTPSYKYFDTACGSGGATRSTWFSRAMFLEYSVVHSVFPANYDCRLTVESSDLNRRVQVRVVYMDTSSSPSCSTGGIIIWDGSRSLTPNYGVCGIIEPSTNYRTTDDKVTIEVTNHGISRFGDFHLLITAFSEPINGSCSANDFKCNNNICISDQLTCNGYNDCGDSSDEIEGCGLTSAVIAAIACCVILFFIVIIVAGVCCVRRRRRYVRVTTTVREYPAVHSNVSYNYQSI